MSSESMGLTAGQRAVPAEPVWQTGVGTVACLAICMLALCWAFRAALLNMYGSWQGTPEVSHGFMIPFVVGYLLWRRRSELATIEFPGSYAGTALLVAAIGLGAIGILATAFTLTQYAFVVGVIGIVLSWSGLSALRRLIVPLLMLAFMVPPPNFVLVMLSSEFQLMSSALGVAVMRLVGVSVFLEGNVIDLGGYRLQVVDACAGLRYLFPLVVLGVLMAYMYQARLWQRIVIVVSSVPLTVVMNGLRIALIGVTVDRWGAQMAEGMLHDVQGWMMFMATAALMVGEVVLLNRFVGGGRDWRAVFGLETPPAPIAGRRSLRPVPNPLIATTVLCAISAGAWHWLPESADTVPARRALSTLPAEVGRFTLHRGVLEREYVDSLQMDDYVLGDLKAPASPPVNLYISYYESQRSGRAVHSPRVCIPANGWRILNLKTIEVQLPGGARQWVNRAIVGYGNERSLVYYWFKQRNRTLTNEWLVKWDLFVDALTRHRTDGGMIRLTTGIALESAEDTDSAGDAALREVMASLAPVLALYVPD